MNSLSFVHSPLRLLIVKLKLFVTIGMTINVLFAESQESLDTIQILSGENRILLSRIPFHTLEVLDNRIHSVFVFTYQDGKYPVRSLGFNSPLSTQIGNYFRGATENATKDERTILLNIRQLRIPNKNGFARKQGFNDGSTRNYQLRNSLLFSAEVYFKIRENRYRKNLTINKIYKLTGSITSIHAVCSELFKELIEASSFTQKSIDSIKLNPGKLKYLVIDDETFVYSKDTIEVTLNSLNTNVKDLWAKYPIIYNPEKQSGYYKDFEDFQMDSLVSSDIDMVFRSKDSTYTIGNTKLLKNKRLPWAIRDTNEVFIKLFDNKYLKAQRENNTFHFYVPESLPNMYALLSMEQIGAMEGFNGSSSGNIFIDIVKLFGYITFSEIFSSARKKKIARSGYKKEYRSCFIEMEHGDIIYFK